MVIPEEKPNGSILLDKEGNERYLINPESPERWRIVDALPIKIDSTLANKNSIGLPRGN